MVTLLKLRHAFRFLAIFVLVLSPKGESSSRKLVTNFNNCPKKSAGAFALKIYKEVDSKVSLYQLKQNIIVENLLDRFFIDSYVVTNDTALNKLEINLNCPSPIAKVQLFKNQKEFDSYEGILVSNGKIYDPTYEIVAKDEQLIKDKALPIISMPVEALDLNLQIEISDALKDLSRDVLEKISEAIIGDEQELTILLSFNNRPVSAFLGRGKWKEKTRKLTKIIHYTELKNLQPTVINLQNEKKVVVKF